MTNKPPKENYIHDSVFKKGVKDLNDKIGFVVKGLNNKIDQEVKGLHQKIDYVAEKLERVAIAQIKTDEGLERVEKTMATKSDINLILDRIDHLVKKVFVFEQEEGVQSIHLIEVQQTVANHEKRLLLLESSR